MGVFYGFSHQRTITTTQRAEHAKHEWESKQKLIDQAKAEYAKKNNPAPAAASKNDGMLASQDMRPLPLGLILRVEKHRVYAEQKTNLCAQLSPTSTTPSSISRSCC